MDKRLIIKILIILVPLELLLWYHVFNNSEGTSDNNLEEISDIRYYGKDFFLLEGTEIADSLKESRYDRLPLSLKNVVREPVWNLSKSSAGMSIRFLSNTTAINVKWTVLNDNKMPHMPESGIKGVDLYFNNNGKFQYLNTAIPSGIESEFLLMQNMSNEMREYKMLLPLYDGLVSIEIGIDSDSQILKADKNMVKPIIFYGTSITQGCCASRPGMVHTNIISRKLNVDVINFGFSGNGMMESPINELISASDPLLYVIECLPNMSSEQVTERTIPLVKTIREKHSKTPIILVENFIYDRSVLDMKDDEMITNKNKALRDEYIKLINSGYDYVYYVEGDNANGDDYEGTNDTVHFNDLGYMRYADYLIGKFVEFGLINLTD